jgi:hypothetical protein
MRRYVPRRATPVQSPHNREILREILPRQLARNLAMVH